MRQTLAPTIGAQDIADLGQPAATRRADDLALLDHHTFDQPGRILCQQPIQPSRGGGKDGMGVGQ